MTFDKETEDLEQNIFWNKIFFIIMTSYVDDFSKMRPYDTPSLFQVMQNKLVYVCAMFHDVWTNTKGLMDGKGLHILPFKAIL